jgi:hypothetical protein
METIKAQDVMQETRELIAALGGISLDAVTPTADATATAAPEAFPFNPPHVGAFPFNPPHVGAFPFNPPHVGALPRQEAAGSSTTG